MNEGRVRCPKNIVTRLITLLFAVLFGLMSVATMPAMAIGDLDELKAKGNVDLTSYSFDELCSKDVVFYGNFENMNNGNNTEVAAIQRAIYYNCNSAQEYYKWLDNALKTIKLDSSKSDDQSNGYNKDTGKASEVKRKSDGKYVFIAEPAILGGDGVSTQQETQAWASYNTTSNKMTRIMARGASEKAVGDVFGQEFDPTNAVTLTAMNFFTMFCNSLFNILAKALMLLFLVQTGFDIVYLTLPFTQGILGPANSSAGGGTAGVANSKNKLPIKFNLVSNEAIEANSRGTTSSVGGSGGDKGMFQSNIALRYLTARAPLIIIAFTYVVLVATNVWADIITWTTSLVTGIFYGL